MAFRCMFASLAVGVGTALKLEDAQNAETNSCKLLIGKNGEFCGRYIEKASEMNIRMYNGSLH